MEPPIPRVALVTGASRGVGAAIAAAFLAEGYAVVGCGRSSRPDEAVAGLDYRVCDVGDPSAISGLVAGVVSSHERLDVLVNNAAVEVDATVEETTVEQWDETLAVNVRAPGLLSAAAIPHMRERGGGVIVNIASIDGLWAEPALPAYCASKGALIGLTRALAIDHGRDGIRCVAICPSYVRTAMLEQFFDSQRDPAAARADGVAMHPIGRLAEPSDIADLAVFLASDRASFLTGHAYMADGGMIAGHL
ncbi:MAG TPA: SDR family oxidoreductase [Gaiellales bacterium]|jgi:meso-butanediol dehydrogenase/(S,S)-butanediol dehydrogenase/diacetyl reductase